VISCAPSKQTRRKRYGELICDIGSASSILATHPTESFLTKPMKKDDPAPRCAACGKMMALASSMPRSDPDFPEVRGYKCQDCADVVTVEIDDD